MSNHGLDAVSMYGWRWLDYADPISVGDQMCRGHIITITDGFAIVGKLWTPEKYHPIRTRIKPPDGHELVPLDEPIPLGAIIDGDIRAMGLSGRTPRALAGEYQIKSAFRPIDDNPWILFADKEPTMEDYPIWVTDWTQVGISNLSRNIGVTFGWDAEPVAKAWKRIKYPPAPKPKPPEQSDEDQAFENWWTRNQDDEHDPLRNSILKLMSSRAWLAAIAWDRRPGV